jgi:hypothetical protein
MKKGRVRGTSDAAGSHKKTKEEHKKQTMAAPAGEREEQYLLRFEDPAIAARVRAVLREEDGADPRDREMALDWDGERGECLPTFARPSFFFFLHHFRTRERCARPQQPALYERRPTHPALSLSHVKKP